LIVTSSVGIRRGLEADVSGFVADGNWQVTTGVSRSR
jgi:hypothetical protein